MTASAEYAQHVLDLLAPLGGVCAQRFFGGVGLASGAVQFAMIMGNRLYFVVDERSRAKYEAAGMEPFSYATRKRRVRVRRYFEVPAGVLEEREQLAAWAREAIAAARGTGKLRKRRRAEGKEGKQ